MLFTVGRERQNAALVLGAPRLFPDRPRRLHLHQQQRRIGAHHAQQRFAREEIERHHDRHRIARQAKQEGTVAVRGNAPESERPPGPHADLPERDFAQAGHDLARVVRFAGRDATGGDDGVGALARSAQRRFQRLRVVAHDSHIDHVAAKAREHAEQGVAVAVVDAALAERLADRAQLVASREEGHAQAPPHRHRGDAKRCDQAQVGRADDLAFSERGAAGHQVFAGKAAVVPGLDGARCDGDAGGADRGHLLMRDHAVASGRHHAARHDAHALAWRGNGVRWSACEGGADHGQRERRVRQQVGAAQGVAIHGRVVMRGHADRRDDVGRQHPAERREQRHLFGRFQRGDTVRDDALRIGDRQGVRVVAREALDGVVQGHACSSYFCRSAAVLILRKALASSKRTRTTLISLYQPSMRRPPSSR